MTKRWKFISVTFGVLTVLTAFSVYLLADSSGSSSGIAAPGVAEMQAEQAGADAGVAPAGAGELSAAVEQPNVEEAASVQLVAGEESGLIQGQEAQQDLSWDPASAGVASAVPAPLNASATPSAETPVEFSLSQNYPNPFNPSTVITYALPVEAQVTLEVYNVVGQRVARLVNESVSAGIHYAQFDGSGLSSGSYMYRLTAKGTDGSVFTKTAKMLLAK